MTETTKVFELAKELNIKALDLIDKIKPLDLRLKNHMSELTGEQVEKIKAFLNPPAADSDVKKKTTVRKAAAKSKTSGTSVTPVVRRKEVVLRREREPDPEEELEALNATGEAQVEGQVENSPVSEGLEVGSEEVAIETSAPAEEEAPISEEQVLVEAGESPASTTEEVTPVVAAPVPPPAAPVAAAPAAPAQVGPGTPVRRGPRYSVIRVVSAEPTPRAKPLIVEEASPNYAKAKTKSAVPKTFSDPELSKSAAALLQKELADEENRRKKSSAGPRAKEDESLFKSTDYLRRERVYQAKKKRISLGRNMSSTPLTTAAAHKRMVDFDTQISVEDLAHQMSVKVMELSKKLRANGVTAPDDLQDGFSDWYLDLETTQLIAHEFNHDVEDNTFREDAFIAQSAQNDDSNLESRPPVVTIMGHVDHGKTSLLDLIRRARVVHGEAGGITQHIGAYTVRVADAIKNLTANTSDAKADKKAKKEKAPKGKAKEASQADGTKIEEITFLDTPGHAAFTAMRSRGARVTDVVILVVAATEGMMPQTREAVEHAKAAGVPIIVAMNKMDLPDANPDRCRQQLSEVGLISEEWGGDVIFVPVSAKTGLGVDKLLEMIQLQAEIMQLKARRDGMAEGIVIEAKLDKGRGPVASVLIKQGTLKIGDFIVAGSVTGKVRALINDKGQNVKDAGPSYPVEILGLSGVPEAGDPMNALDDEKASRELADFRVEQKRLEAQSKGFTLEDIYSKMNEGEIKELPIIIKADVKGSAEAIQASLLKLPTAQVRLKILSAGVGAITESDVLLASASKAIVFGFSVRPDGKAESLAEQKGVQIKSYDIIYKLLDEVTAAMTGLLAPTNKETVMGRAEVRNVFTITKVGAVAGSFIIKGKVQRSNSVRLIRDNRVIYTGKLSGLRRFKDDVKEVAEGYECGISIENYNDLKVGDIVEAYSVESVQGVLNTSSPQA